MSPNLSSWVYLQDQGVLKTSLKKLASRTP